MQKAGRQTTIKKKTQLTREGPQNAVIWTQEKLFRRGSDAFGAHSASPLRPAPHLDGAAAETSVNEAAQRRQYPSTANSLC